jgi:hypothetical protein
MTSNDPDLVPFILTFSEPLPASSDGEAQADLPAAETRFTRAMRETTDDE